MAESVVVDFQHEPEKGGRRTAPHRVDPRPGPGFVDGYATAKGQQPARILLQATDLQHCVRRILARMQKPHREKAKAAWQEQRAAGSKQPWREAKPEPIPGATLTWHGIPIEGVSYTRHRAVDKSRSGDPMFFRSLTMFRFPVATDLSEIAQLLPAAALKPVGPLEMSSRGFVSPLGREETEQLFHGRDGWLWLAIGGQDKILPASVVADRLEEKMIAIERTEGRCPGGRERNRIKDDLLHEMLPGAMVKSSRTDLFLDTEHGVAFVDTTSRKSGEFVMSDICGLLGSFPAMPLNAEVAPRSILTGWLAGEPLPDGLALGVVRAGR